MSDLGPLSLGYSLPDADYEAGILQWIRQNIEEGEAILKDEPAYDDIDKSISFIMGDQADQQRPGELSNVCDNRSKNILNQTVAALTDIHPLFGFSTKNPNFKEQEEVLIKLSQAWWVNNFCDLKLADVIKFSAGIGTGYCEVSWDASIGNGTGDINLRALDPRDVIPIKPVLSGTVQDWEGIVIRTAKSPEELRTRFPDKAHRITADNIPSIIARTWTRAKKAMSTIISPSAVDHMNAQTNAQARNAPKRLATADVYTVYVKDRRLCTASQPLIMGDPKTTWSYTVYPVGWDKVPDGIDSMGQPKVRKAKLEDCKLYPRGRMIVATNKVVLYDGPNPYWHGMFPVVKLCLDPWPWTLLGTSLLHDIIPLQNAFNETLNGIMDHVRKLLRPAVVADKKSIANSIWERLDSRLAGMKLKTNQSIGKGVEFVSPEPLPAYTFEVLKWIAEEMDYHAGTANLSALTQLQQMPGEDTIEKMQEALAPVLRLKGRLLEYFLRELGEMVKGNFFQFYNMPRRIAMLGDQGIVFNDFDFDPGTLVPSMSQEDEGYSQELDKSKPRAERAQWFHKNFTFTITPNSLLAISQISRKMMYLQLRQMQLVDRWTLYEVLEVPNGGAAPGDPNNITDRLAAENMMMMQQQIMAQSMAAGMMGGMMGAPSMGGPSPSGMGPGQPDSMQKPPQLLNKTDSVGAPRQTLSTSGSGGG